MAHQLMKRDKKLEETYAELELKERLLRLILAKDSEMNQQNDVMTELEKENAATRIELTAVHEKINSKEEELASKDQMIAKLIDANDVFKNAKQHIGPNEASQ